MNWVWTAWLAVIASSFAAFESYAIAKNKTTLSRYIWTATKAWPPIPFVIGLLIGGLAVHFWWHWCPDLSIGYGAVGFDDQNCVMYLTNPPTMECTEKVK